jgi:integrase
MNAAARMACSGSVAGLAARISLKGLLDAELKPGAGNNLPPWVLHDLRRTAASGMASLAVPPHVVEAVLNHKSGVIRGVASVYNRYSYATEKRAALDAWGQHVAALTAPFDALAAAA